MRPHHATPAPAPGEFDRPRSARASARVVHDPGLRGRAARARSRRPSGGAPSSASRASPATGRTRSRRRPTGGAAPRAARWPRRARPGRRSRGRRTRPARPGARGPRRRRTHVEPGDHAVDRLGRRPAVREGARSRPRDRSRRSSRARRRPRPPRTARSSRRAARRPPAATGRLPRGEPDGAVRPPVARGRRPPPAPGAARRRVRRRRRSPRTRPRPRARGWRATAPSRSGFGAGSRARQALEPRPSRPGCGAVGHRASPPRSGGREEGGPRSSPRSTRVRGARQSAVRGDIAPPRASPYDERVLDARDRDIIAALQEDARATYADVAARVGPVGLGGARPGPQARGAGRDPRLPGGGRPRGARPRRDRADPGAAVRPVPARRSPRARRRLPRGRGLLQRGRRGELRAEGAHPDDRRSSRS